MMHRLVSQFSISFAALTLAIAGLSTSLFLPNSVARANPTAPASTTAAEPPLPSREVDSSLSRDYTPATIYIHDPTTHELVPKVALVATDQPVEGAVQEIIHAYEGQDVGIKSYEVKVNPTAKAAQINFDVDNPRGARAFQSLSSANQYSVFEAIRETLALPTYNVRRVIFSANGKPFEI